MIRHCRRRLAAGTGVWSHVDSRERREIKGRRWYGWSGQQRHLLRACRSHGLGRFSNSYSDESVPVWRLGHRSRRDYSASKCGNQHPAPRTCHRCSRKSQPSFACIRPGRLSWPPPAEAQAHRWSMRGTTDPPTLNTSTRMKTSGFSKSTE